MNYSKIKTHDFIKRLPNIDNNYDYSLVDYKNMHKKIKIICKKHGVFEQTPINLLNGFLCKKCKKEKSNNKKLDILLNKANKIHKNKYDYSLVVYDKMISNVNIICKEHGKFEQSLNNHINQKKGCPKCVKNFKLLKEDFIKRSNIIHNNFYDYSLINFINVATKINIICPEHGIFYQTPNNHLNGHGCPICKESKGEKLISNILEDLKIKFIKQKKFKECKDKRQLPFDFYLPDYNICNEYD